MTELVYLLCALTSILCGYLLFRGYRESRTKLLLWSSICFAGLALNNVLLVLDLVLVTQADLSILRSSIALLALFALLFGLVWESR